MKSFLCEDFFIRFQFNFHLKLNQEIYLLQCYSELQEAGVDCSLNLESSKVKALFVHDFNGFKFHFFRNGKGIMYGKNLTKKVCEVILVDFYEKFVKSTILIL